MAYEDMQREYVFKKTLGFEHTTLDATWDAESPGTGLILPSHLIWQDSGNIPSTPPGATSSIVEVYDRLQLTLDPLIEGKRCWRAKDPAQLRNFIPPMFSPDPANSYKVQLSEDLAGTQVVNIIGMPWVFDYDNGIISFVNNADGTWEPEYNYSTLYLLCYRYIGVFGVGGAAGGGLPQMDHSGQACYIYRNLGGAHLHGTGYCKITLPFYWGDNEHRTMYRMVIVGMDYVSKSNWTLTLSGYLYDVLTTSKWYYTRAFITGNPPFNLVMQGDDGNNLCILLGSSTSVWGYAHVWVKELTVGYGDHAAWHPSDWTLEILATVPGWEQRQHECDIEMTNLGSLSATTIHGSVRIGPMNASYCHINTDRPKFYFYKTIYLAAGQKIQFVGGGAIEAL